MVMATRVPDCHTLRMKDTNKKLIRPSGKQDKYPTGSRKSGSIGPEERIACKQPPGLLVPKLEIQLSDEDNDQLVIDENVNPAADGAFSASGGGGHAGGCQNTPRRKFNNFMGDKVARMRSYVRRRAPILKRICELDLLCGTKSFVLQISPDMGEIVYCGHDDLVHLFLSHEGLKVSDVGRVIEAREHFDNELQRLAKKKGKGDKANNERPGEPPSQLLQTESVRTRKFKTTVTSLFAKLKENEIVCGGYTFALSISLELEAAFYQSSPYLATWFFTKGIARRHLGYSMNVRRFLPVEVDYNMCRVPMCLVSRNSLGKWWLAAVRGFDFPPELPMTLHFCPESERDQWMAEIDIHPDYKAKIAVCSFHFRDGYPTSENPLPTEMLNNAACNHTFRGRRPSPEGVGGDAADSLVDNLVHQLNMEVVRSVLEAGVLVKVYKEIDRIEKEREMERKLEEERLAKRNLELQPFKSVRFVKFANINKKYKSKIRPERTKRRLWAVKTMPAKASASNDSTPRTTTRRPGVAKGRRVNRALSHQARLSIVRRLTCGLLACRFCQSRFKFSKALFQHVRNEHVKPAKKREYVEVTVDKIERKRILAKLYPSNQVLMEPGKKYVCAVCKSVCDLHGLFDHMKEVHKGLLCEHCLKLFLSAKSLEQHLRSAHSVQGRYYHDFNMFKEYSGDNYTFACPTCSHVLTIEEAERHKCGEENFECLWCRKNYDTQSELESHIVTGSCPKMKLFHYLPARQNIQVAYKILTGKNPEVSDPVDEVQEMTMDDSDITSYLQVDITDEKTIPKAQDETTIEMIANGNRNGIRFSCFDRNILLQILRSAINQKDMKRIDYENEVILDEIPSNGSIFYGEKATGISNNIVKEFNDMGRNFSVHEEMLKQQGQNELAVADSVRSLGLKRAGKHFIIMKATESDKDTVEPSESFTLRNAGSSRKRSLRQKALTGSPSPAAPVHSPSLPITPPVQIVVPIKPKSETRQERVIRVRTEIDNNLTRLRDAIQLFPSCMFCQQCRIVTVDAQFLLSHLMVVHNECAELRMVLLEDIQFCINRIKKHLKEIRKKEVLFSFLTIDEELTLDYYRCSYCSTTSCGSYQDLIAHTLDQHDTKVLTCNICQNIFLNYGSLINHVCGGPPSRPRFSCRLCRQGFLPSFLDFQTHIRKEHNTCEICFLPQGDQVTLYSHCATHDQDLMCMKCLVTFVNADSFRKHMFWKHMNAQEDCPSCHLPTWPNVYHFCLTNVPLPCHACEAVLPGAAALKVHLRSHTGNTPHVCDQPKCNRSYISKSLLWKHQVRRHPALKDSVSQLLTQRKLRKEIARYGVKEVESLEIIHSLVNDLWEGFCMAADESAKLKVNSQPTEATTPLDNDGEPAVEENSAEPLGESGNPESVLDAAIRSILPELDEAPPDPEPGGGIPAEQSDNILVSPDRAAVHSTIAGRSYTEDNSWQAGLDALLAGASVPLPSNDPPEQLLQVADQLEVKNASDSSSEGGSSTEEDDAETESGSSSETRAPVLSGLWNQDLMFISKHSEDEPKQPPVRTGPKVRGGGVTASRSRHTYRPSAANDKMHHGSPGRHQMGSSRIKTLEPQKSSLFPVKNKETARVKWDLDLSEASSDDEFGPHAKKTPSLKQRTLVVPKPLLDHDYCYAAFMMSQDVVNDTEEMEKIVSNVAFGETSFNELLEQPDSPALTELPTRKRRKKRKEKRKKKKRRTKSKGQSASASSESEDDKETVEENVDMFGIEARNKKNKNRQSDSLPTPRSKPWGGSSAETPLQKRGPKPKYHTPDVAKTSGVVAGTARPSFDTDSESGRGESDKEDLSGSPCPSGDEEASTDDISSSDLDTDFSADEKVAPVTETDIPVKSKGKSPVKSVKPALKLKLKLPKPKSKKGNNRGGGSSVARAPKGEKSRASTKNRGRRSSAARRGGGGYEDDKDSRPLSKKMQESLALNLVSDSSDEGNHSERSDENKLDDVLLGDAMAGDANNQLFGRSMYEGGGDNDDDWQSASGATADKDQIYCYCQCPHDGVSEMIGCDAPDCRLEWFHFECVGVVVPPEGKWYCPDCTKRYGLV